MSILSHDRHAVKGIPFEDILHAFGHLDGLADLEGQGLGLVEYLEAVRDHFRKAERFSDGAHLVADAIGDLVNEAIILGRPRDVETFHDRRDGLARSL